MLLNCHILLKIDGIEMPLSIQVVNISLKLTVLVLATLMLPVFRSKNEILLPNRNLQKIVMNC